MTAISKINNILEKYKVHNTLERIDSRLDEGEDQISDLGDKVEKNMQEEQQKEKKRFKKMSLNILDNIKLNKIKLNK